MKRLKAAAVAAAVLAALYFMPFVTLESTDNAGRTWRVPFGTAFSHGSGDSITFSGYRSAYSLAKDSEMRSVQVRRSSATAKPITIWKTMMFL